MELMDSTAWLALFGALMGGSGIKFMEFYFLRRNQSKDSEVEIVGLTKHFFPTFKEQWEAREAIRAVDEPLAIRLDRVSPIEACSHGKKRQFYATVPGEEAVDAGKKYCDDCLVPPFVEVVAKIDPEPILMKAQAQDWKGLDTFGALMDTYEEKQRKIKALSEEIKYNRGQFEISQQQAKELKDEMHALEFLKNEIERKKPIPKTGFAAVIDRPKATYNTTSPMCDNCEEVHVFGQEAPVSYIHSPSCKKDTPVTIRYKTMTCDHCYVNVIALDSATEVPEHECKAQKYYLYGKPITESQYLDYIDGRNVEAIKLAIGIPPSRVGAAPPKERHKKTYYSYEQRAHRCSCGRFNCGRVEDEEEFPF